MKGFILILVFITAGLFPCSSAEKKGIALLEELLSEERYTEADNDLRLQLRELYNAQNTDSLSAYPYYFGKIISGLKDLPDAMIQVENFLDTLRTLGSDDRRMHDAKFSYVNFLDEKGQTRRSYEITLRILELARKMENNTPEEIGFVKYNLGVNSWNLGDFDQARSYFRRALHYYESFPEVNPDWLADGYNALGAMMWLGSQLDSARHYYQKTIETIAVLPSDSTNKAFRTAITLANMALIQQSQLQTAKAIEILERALALYSFTIRNTDDDALRRRAEAFRLRSIGNLASFYNAMGNYRLAAEMTQFVNDNYRETFHENDPNVYKALINMGESQMSLRNYKKANGIFRESLDLIEGSGGENAFWKAVALSNLAETEAELGNTKSAAGYFAQSRQYFERALGGRYDRTYLTTLGKTAAFLARTGKYEQAEETALFAYNFVSGTVETNGTLIINSLTSLAEVSFLAGNYKKAQQYAVLALERADEEKSKLGSVADFLQLERLKPRIHLVYARALYHSREDKDSLMLTKVYDELNKSREILEKRNRFFTAGENVSALLDENQELYDWLKKISLDLYVLTQDNSWLERLIDYHEYSIFQRIRLRFLLRNSIRFYGVPEEVVKKEFDLMQQFSGVITEAASEAEPVFSQTLEQWEEYLNNLQLNYPDYFRMRFSSLSGNINAVRADMPANTAIVRYFYVLDDLYALVITHNTTHLVALQAEELSEKIKKLNIFLPEPVELNILHQLYNLLWLPLEEHVTTHNVIILPDKDLFNLSFETLVPAQVKSWSDLAQYSLLARHAISYNFSLSVMQGNRKNPGKFSGNYIAFAPGFTEEMKLAYKEALQGREMTDDEYLSLLPQPFTLEVAANMKRRLRGSLFGEGRSTRDNFIRNAAGHRILHIGTHAEVDNLSPEFSRLIFAKDLDRTDEIHNNHLYSYQIYHYNFASLLTVLTACETGKPQYRPGEGMTSLAHAFHYAGSESLLISLWQIDEHASAVIMNVFYRYLSKGDNKAEALRKAKLDYLATAWGRALSPVYWAGIVVMGDPSPVAVRRSAVNWYLLALALIMAGGIFYGLRLRYKKF